MATTPKRLDSTRAVRRTALLPVPPLLRDFMDGTADLIRELEGRYQTPPLMSLFRVNEARAGVAILATQDGAATLTVEVDNRSNALDCTFRLNSMLGHHFSLRSLSDLDRTRWLAILREGEAEPVLLWTAARWNQDYLIASAHRYYTNLFAFAPQHAEAAARLTPEASRKLLDWLDARWFAPAEPGETALNW